MSDFDDSELFEDGLFQDEEPVGGQFDDFEDEVDEGGSKGEGKNRNFMVAVGVLAAIFLISLIALVVFAGMVLPQRNAAREAEAVALNAANTEVAMAATEESVAYSAQQTLSSFPTATVQQATKPPVVEESPLPEATITKAVQPTQTEVVAQPTETVPPDPTETESPAEALSSDPAAHTATIAALLTLSAGGGEASTSVPVEGTVISIPEAMTSTAGAPTSQTYYYPTVLPETGFADEVGLPGLLGGAAVLVALIILVRRLRSR